MLVWRMLLAYKSVSVHVEHMFWARASVSLLLLIKRVSSARASVSLLVERTFWAWELFSVLVQHMLGIRMCVHARANACVRACLSVCVCRLCAAHALVFRFGECVSLPVVSHGTLVYLGGFCSNVTQDSVCLSKVFQSCAILPVRLLLPVTCKDDASTSEVPEMVF